MSDNLLVLKKIRIRGLGSVVDSNWFEIGQKLTFFAMPQDFDSRGFFCAIQATNPPYSIVKRQPFNDYPLIHRDGKYQKRVRPDRRTISLTIFVAQPETVMMLGKISPHLYETDRIEVGRKLNYSRWLNFVEIASSSRWSEVEAEIKELMNRYKFPDDSPFAQRVAGLKPTDRIKDATLDFLNDSLVELLTKAKNTQEKDNLEEVLFTVQRQHHFNKGKSMVEALLPCFHYFNADDISIYGSEGKEGGSELHSLIRIVDATIDQSKKSQQSKPIFMFDETGLTQNTIKKQEMRKYVNELSSSYQCLYMLKEEESVEESENIKVVRLGNLVS